MAEKMSVPRLTTSLTGSSVQSKYDGTADNEGKLP
jgi:hypothetical protein